MSEINLTKRIRGHRGYLLRRARLAVEPLCRICMSKGVVREATVPDHIIPLAKGGTEENSNIRCLCEDCHRDVTNEEFGYKPKPRFGLDGWPL